ncbi:MAG TPA: hypothetical protein VHL53_14770, partial [Acidimicrobiia bacterium]|nr:hypothetical protein [Acidimicrobiia bacterium]
MGLARALSTAVVVALCGLGVLLPGAAPAFADAGTPPGIPAGFTVAGQRDVAPGVTQLDLVRAKPPLAVHVAHLAPDAAASLRAVLSNDQVAGQEPIGERTSSMCQRVHCLVAVNGDFAGGDDQPLGGLLSGGELLRTP